MPLESNNQRVALEVAAGVRGFARLPFTVGVISDLGGVERKPLVGGKTPADNRQFIGSTTLESDDGPVDLLGVVFKRVAPRLELQVADHLGGNPSDLRTVAVEFTGMADFSPALISQRTPGLAEVHEACNRFRRMLSLLASTDELGHEFESRLAEGVPALAGWLKEVLSERVRRVPTSADDTEERRSAAREQGMIERLASWASQAASLTAEDGDLFDRSFVLVAAMERGLARQVAAIMRHPEFRRLEAAWRGLEYLVSSIAPDEEVVLQVLDVSRSELGRTAVGVTSREFERDPLFIRIYEQEYGQYGGEPFGCLVVDFEFDHSTPDVERLARLAEIGAAAHAPILTAASPALMPAGSWRTWTRTTRPQTMRDAEHAEWQTLRESSDARYLGLTLPRFLARPPWGPRTRRCTALEFDELELYREIAAVEPHADVESDGATDTTKDGPYLWANSAFALAGNIVRAFREYGWCARIRGSQSGGVVDNLPRHRFGTDPLDIDAKVPLEAFVEHSRERELADHGLIPLVPARDPRRPVFLSACSLAKAEGGAGDEFSEANVELGTRLPYLLTACRVAHFIKVRMRRKAGTYTSADDLANDFNNWLSSFENQQVNATERQLAERPFWKAEVEARPDERDPGMIHATFRLQPRYQLESIQVEVAVDLRHEVQSGGSEEKRT